MAGTDVERLIVLVEANTKQTENALKRLERMTGQSFNRQARAVAGFDAQLKRMSATAMKAAGALGIAFGARALVGFIKGAVEAGAHVGDLANRLGITAEQVQEFSFAASQAGASQEAFVKAMTGMNRIVGDAARGLKAAQQEFAALGIATDDLKGKDPGQVFQLIIDRIRLLEDPLQRNAALIKFFGRSGLEMAEMVKIGAAGIDELRARARELGLVLTNEEIAKLKEAGDQISLIGTAGQAAGERIAIAFLPAIDAIAKLVTSPEFQSGLKGTAEYLGAIVKFLADNPIVLKALTGAAIGGRIGGWPGALTGGLLGAVINPGGGAQRIGGPGTAKPMEITVPGNNRGRVPPPGFGSFDDPAVDQQAKRFEALAASLALAQANLFATDREQAIANDLARLGADATEKQRAAIELLSGQLYDQKAAQEAANKAMAEMKAVAEDFLGGFISDMRQGVSATEALGNALNRLADRLISSGLNALLDGIFNPKVGGGNIFSWLFGGARAMGGPVSPSRAYMVGERGPELFVPQTAGRIEPSGGGRGISFTYAPQIDARGADTAAVAKLANEMAKDRAAFTARVKGVLADPRAA